MEGFRRASEASSAFLGSLLMRLKDIGKTAHNLLDLSLRELRAYPNDDPGYFEHMGLSPDDLSTT